MSIAATTHDAIKCDEQIGYQNHKRKNPFANQNDIFNSSSIHEENNKDDREKNHQDKSLKIKVIINRQNRIS